MTVSKAALTRFIALTAFTVFASHAALAADKAAAKAASTSAEGIQTVSDDASDQPAGVKAQSGTAVLETNRTTPATTSTASLPGEIKAASPRTVFGEYYAETYTAIDDVQKGQGTPRIDSYAGVKFDLGNSRAFSVRQNFDYTGAAANGVGNFHVQDIALNYADGKLATFAGDGSLTIIAREYLPTGENSRFLTGNKGAERVYLIAAKSYGKLDLDVLTLGQISNNTKDSYMGADGKEAQNRWGLGVIEFDAMYNITSKFSAGITLENDYLFFKPLAGNPDSQTDIVIEPIVQYAPIKGLAIQAALVNTIDTGHPDKAFALMRHDEMKAFLNLAASL